ncbi:MAG: histidine phosphatase family protein [Bifidobacterium aquikefiri]|uniref:Phosphoglycerate mutase n=1 Tax=Bifidobacterium aquikefiri TaxID=1653207 RepID=A0A261GBN7_9BIFI|nr:histidine phosphatase family protein [Bifidobacterium aquikefiri]OZG68838.1 phosphoglycerate mutase [Bifidobacterium aquikefiri]
MADSIQTVNSIILVRHGRTGFNAQHRLQGQIEQPLDKDGLWQVTQTARALNTLYVEHAHEVPKQLVVSSDLNRALDTAHQFADPLNLEVHTDPAFRERSYGDWEGMSRDEIQSKWPEDFKLWQSLDGGELKHHAEPLEDVGKRGASALQRWATSAGADTNLFIFAHGTLIETLLHTVLGIHSIPPCTSLVGMRNAHWARLIPLHFCNDDGEHLKWRLSEYNRGPAIASTGDWHDITPLKATI